MKLMSDYPKSIAPSDNTTYGTFKDETQPGAGDGTDIKAAQMQDLYYALYQVLGLAGQVPNGELENSQEQKQFLSSLAHIGWLKYDSSLSYAKNTVVWNTVNDITRLYRSQRDNNTAPLDNPNGWYNILTIDANNVINLNSIASNGIFIGSFLYGIRKDAPAGFLRCDGTEYSRSQYPQLYDEFLLTGKVATKTYAEYATQDNDNAGNVGYFGIDTVTQTFKVPKIQAGTFLAQAFSDKQLAQFREAGLPNITGEFGGIEKRNFANVVKGAFYDTNVRFEGAAAGENDTIVGFDASRCSNIYGRSDTVTPTHIRYPLFVCVANAITSEVSKEDITKEIVQAGGTQKERLETIAGTQLYLPGTLIHSSCVLHQAGLYPANGDLLAGNGVYTDFYNYIMAHPEDFRLITEEIYQQELALSGQCGGYVLDTENGTLRIPTITKFVEGIVNLKELGVTLPAGLPNITGGVNIGVANANYCSGVFNLAKTKIASAAGNGNYGSTASFDATRCSPIYGNSETVQPEAISYPVYIVVGTVTKTELINNLDNLANDLVLRANIDGSNALFNHLSNTGIDNLVQTLFPDFTTEIVRSWNTSYFTNQAVYLIGEVKTEASSVGAMEVSLDQTTWHRIWVGENWNTVSSACFNLLIPRGYYYRGVRGSNQTLCEYQLHRTIK